jgi:hypothetical protein
MATIFERVPASGEKCLVLDSKEFLLYPFDLGDWERIRIGVALSLTNSSQLNGGLEKESIKDLQRYDYTRSFYFGIKTNNEFYPDPNKCSYIGVGSENLAFPYYSSNDFKLEFYNDSQTCDIYYTVPVIMPSGNFNDQAPYSNYKIIRLPFTFNQSGLNSYFCNMFCLEIKIKNKGTSNQSYSIIMESNINDYESQINGAPAYAINFPSLSQMRKTLANVVFNPSPDTGYFTSTFNNSGTPSPIPDAFFISNPFLFNRLRIHGILIEKYE